tara:strand:+ start:32 stop:1072 length:1041 start_codon:yes stop_codon:yes gene_type:complete
MAYISFKPSDYFNTTNYSGNSSTQTITTGLANDMVWIKDTASAINNEIFDTVRGATKYLVTNSNGTENSAHSDNLTAFGSTGFTLGANAGNDINHTGHDYSSMNWRMGTTTGIAGSADITPSAYSFNQTAGMSIIKYTGSAGAIRTVLHGLGSAPDLIIIKQLTSSTNAWVVGADAIVSNWGGVLTLNTTAAIFTNAYFGGAVPDATKFSISNTSEVNSSGTYVAYCFKSIKGFSAIGNYTGNGNADGSFVYTGFEPAMVITKSVGGIAAWGLYTTHNVGYNPTNKPLAPDSNGGLNSTYVIDILSNGFKPRHADAQLNASGTTYMYYAVAKNPIVGSNGTTGVAR